MGKHRKFISEIKIPEGTPVRNVEDMSVEELEKLRKGLKKMMQGTPALIVLDGDGIDNKH